MDGIKIQSFGDGSTCTNERATMYFDIVDNADIFNNSYIKYEQRAHKDETIICAKC